jgi:hypothetical protein
VMVSKCNQFPSSTPYFFIAFSITDYLPFMFLKGSFLLIFICNTILLDKIKNQYSENGSDKTDQKNTVRRSKDFLIIKPILPLSISSCIFQA